MPLVPLPFIVIVLLLVVLLRMLRERDDERERRDDSLFVALVAAYALESVLIGLRWGYGMRVVLPAQAVLGVSIAALAYAAFSRLAGGPRLSQRPGPAFHALPAVLVALLHLIGWREAIAPAVILVFLGYGAALLRLTLAGPDGLTAARLDGAPMSFRALQITTAAILASAATDILISLDYAVSGGAYSGMLVAMANVAALLVLAQAASAVRTSRPTTAEPVPETERDVRPREAPSEEDRATAARLACLMTEKALYKDAELNLSRIARRMGLPARQVSNAVNRVHGSSVSQYVNDLRIAEACRILKRTTDPVIKVMFEVGFLSKSNFHRGFLRVTGASPTAWRRSEGFAHRSASE